MCNPLARFALTLVGLLAGATLTSHAHAFPAQLDEVRACWMTQYAYLGMTESELRAAAQEMRAGGLNTVYFNVYGGGGQTFWPSKAFVAAGGISAITTFDQTRYLVRVFREEGLTVGAWFEYGLALSSVSHPIAVAHSDWLARDIGGDPVTGENGGFVFLSPGHPEVKQLMVDMSRELAESYAFDDIQLDRFRWGRKSTGREYGYETVTSNLYQAQFGSTPPSNRNNSQWVSFREGLVNDVVEACYDAIKAANPQVVVSSAPTGSYGITQHMQRWSSWVNGGYMDLVMPQMYLTTLSSFISEFNTQRAQAGAHVDKLGVGYRAQDANDWGDVRLQLDHARAQGVPHGALWVYHFYTSVPAIRDELQNLPLPGRPWEQQAQNPFVSDCNELFFVDDADAGYEEVGTGWVDSAQGDFFAFGSRVAPGGGGAMASFTGAISRAGIYEVHAWYTASGNRNPAARYTIEHAGGSTEVFVDQRVDGGQWVELGEFLFFNGPERALVSLDTHQASAQQFTSADSIRLRLVDCLPPLFEEYCFGDGGAQPGCTPCPCANDSDAGGLAGCLNSNGLGARLNATGVPSLSADTLRFEVTGATSNAFGILTSGNNRLPNSAANPCFGLGSGITGPALDGLRCQGGALQRHGTRSSDGLGRIGATTNGWGAPSGPVGGILAQGGFSFGQTRHFQVFYREGVTQGCGTGQNTTNAVSVLVVP